MKYSVKLLQAGPSQENQFFYPLELLHKIANDTKLPIFGGMASNAKENEYTHKVVELTVDSDCLYAQIEMLDNPRGLSLNQQYQNGSIGFRISGTGKLDYQDVIDYHSFDLKSIRAISIASKSKLIINSGYSPNWTVTPTWSTATTTTFVTS